MIQKILVAEDEGMTRRSISEALGELFPETAVYTAENGQEAVELAKREEIQLAFLDIRMPVMDGITAAQQIDRLHKGCQIVFLTAYSDFEYIRQALAVGAVDYILKPFTRTSLTLAVQKAEGRLAQRAPGGEEHDRNRMEISRLSHLVEEQILLQLMSGYQSRERLAEELEQRGIYARAGRMAVLDCRQEGLVQRVKNMIKGGGWGSEVKLLTCGVAQYLVLFAASATGGAILERFSRQLEHMLKRMRGPLHMDIRCGIGRVFEDLQDAQAACFEAFCELSFCSEEEPCRMVKVSEEGFQPVVSFGADRICRDEANAERYRQAVSDFCGLLPLNFRGRREESCRFFEELLRRKGRGAEWVSVRARLLSASDEAELKETGGLLWKELMYETGSQGEEPAYEETAERIKAYIAAHYGENLTMERLAKELQYSKTYCSRLFMKLFGQSFSSYLTELRLARSRALLADPSVSIQEAARQTGFRDTAYFSSVFRKKEGMTPSAYRNQIRQRTGEDRA